MVLLSHPEKSSEGHDGKQNTVGSLVENDVLNVPDLVAGGVADVGAQDLFGPDGVRVAGGGWHSSALLRVLSQMFLSPVGSLPARRSWSNPSLATFPVGIH